MLNDKFTIVTPAALFNGSAFAEFETSIRTLYRSLNGQRPRHLFSFVGNPSYLDSARRLLMELGARFLEVSNGATALNAFFSMTNEVSTDYMYMHLADVRTVGEKDFMTPCLQAMEKDPSLVQVRVGGYPFSCGANNTCMLWSKDGKICFDMDTTVSFEPLPVESGDTVWTIPMTPENQKFFYAVPLWNTVMRTSYVKETLRVVGSMLRPTDRTLTHITEHINGAEDLVLYYLPKTGWKPQFSYMNKYKQGSLNFACYVYALGALREEHPYDEFLRTNTREIKVVPLEGAI